MRRYAGDWSSTREERIQRPEVDDDLASLRNQTGSSDVNKGKSCKK